MTEDKKPLLLLFDGNALVHRAFHALPPLTQSQTGELLNAVYGFASTLLKVLNEFKPTHWAIAFDRPAPTFRHELFQEYKARRPTAPEELRSQIRRVHQLASAFHIPIYEVDGFEADDVLATLGKQANEQGIEAIIVTGDNDMLQTILPGVRALVPKRSFGDTVLYDEAAVEKRFGIKPKQLADFKALIGDVSDNIPGIPGVGEKTATKLLQRYATIEGIYQHIDKITPPKLQETLRQYRDQVFQNKKLCTVVTDAPVTLDLKTCQLSHYDRDEVVKLFQELEFVHLLPRLPQIKGRTSQPLKVNYQVIANEAALEEVVTRLLKADNFAMEVEATGARLLDAHLAAVTLSPSADQTFFLAVEHAPLPSFGRLPLTQVVTELKPVCENPGIGKIVHDGKRVMSILANYGVRLQNLNFDTMIAAYLLGEKNLDLPTLAFKKLGVEIVSAPFGSGDKEKKQASLSSPASGDEFARYCCSKANILWALKEELASELVRQELWELFTQVELALIPVLATMERNGILLDTELLRAMSQELGYELRRLEKQIYDSVGHEFNINSPQQLSKVLFQELRLPQSRKKKGGFSTEASVLEALKGTHPVIELILQYRQLSKLKSTYADALPALINPTTKRVHTTFNQVGTATGRLSSSDPNLQNIPVRGELGIKIRKAIIAPPGAFLVSADYSQIDLRVLAHLSQDPALVAAFMQDEDIHTMTASRLFGVSPEQVTPAMRRNAKTVNFGVIYGMSDYGLEQATTLSREEASQFISLYFEKYPKVKEYIETTKEKARKFGYVRTVLGRKRFLPEINSSNRIVREAAERMAINAPVQGSSADIIKIAMINLHREMEKQNLHSKMLLQIHDELLFEVPETELEQMKSLISDLMPKAFELCVPLKIDIKVGKNWGEMA